MNKLTNKKIWLLSSIGTHCNHVFVVHFVIVVLVLSYPNMSWRFRLLWLAVNSMSIVMKTNQKPQSHQPTQNRSVMHMYHAIVRTSKFANTVMLLCVCCCVMKLSVVAVAVCVCVCCRMCVLLCIAGVCANIENKLANRLQTELLLIGWMRSTKKKQSFLIYYCFHQHIENNTITKMLACWCLACCKHVCWYMYTKPELQEFDIPWQHDTT